MNSLSLGRALGGRIHLATSDHVLPLIARVRFQLLGGLLACVAMPLLLHEHFIRHGQSSATAVNAGIGAIMAIVVGYYFMRRIGSFPGVQSGAHILFAVSAPYASVVAGFLLLRFDYSRFVLVSSYLLALVWFVGVHLAAKAVVRPELVVVPGGHADCLTVLRQVRWLRLQAPPEVPGRISAVVADLRQDLSAGWERFLADCTVQGVPVFHSKQVHESLTGKVDIEHLSESSFGSLLPSLAYLKLKQMIDWMVALLLFPLLVLVVLIIAPLIVLESGRPVFFRQERMGHRGRVIRVCKFRTMRTAAPKGNSHQAAITVEDDQRVTRVGRFLRRYRIDELPQILNILKGEMSWIGPRPEAVPLAQWYEAELPFYRYRYVVRPGITGWAQVNQGHVASPGEVRDKLRYDFFYIKYLSPWLDLVIAMRTAVTVLRGFGAK